MENIKEAYKERSKQTFNDEANIYESTYNGKHAKKLYSLVVENVNGFNCRNVLDVGCGTGTILSLLSENDDISLSGLDLSENMLDIAGQRLNKKAELKIGDSEHLPWKNNVFDGIICTDSFHHYTEPEKVLSEMARVLKPNGHLIIADPWSMPVFRQLTNFLFRFSKDGDYKLYSKMEMIDLLIKANFHLVKWDRVNYNSFIVTGEVNK